ncbi:protein FAR1-RELATED SEQUENCE 5-like [Medicago truncatula]|uniref:protein FAR1-RELATED SEQUENCE 5-like n=1 Tax=Medicago truncatula TaxID=3880 RepID=UPI00023669D2|nr:protein FAR1-RELATED SEQUENCE 5-like [Medicago truncatula]
MNPSSILVDNSVDKLVNTILEENEEHGQESIADIKPCLDMIFESEVAAYEFYNEYSKRIGFGIRREYGNKSKKDGVLTSRRFTCYKEGTRSVDKRRQPTGESTAETRTGCNARMGISLDRKIGKYKVVDFVLEHNHLLQPQEYVHMIRSHRRISEVQASQIIMGDESGLRPKELHEYMSKQAGGIEMVGFTRTDAKNLLRTKRMDSLKYGEVGALMTYFKQESKNPSFFYDFQMDVEEQITNIFWADAQMINDYGYFGDVVTFDTTYKTNKGYRPLGVVVGLNNHRQTIIFGATLLYDETIPSFQWLFETFLKAMGGKKPKTILTDQDAAMAKGISLVMPETFHGLCTWHIRQNALRHVNHLYQRSKHFCSDFEACIDLHEEEDEFLNAWNSLLVEHNVLEGSWLHMIFRFKEKWAWTYVRKTFTAGMRSTQLSESFNADLKNHLKSDLNLIQFFTHFKRAVNGKRNNESEAEYESRHKLPRLKMKKARMLVQAGNVYTPKIFEEFQEEYEEYQDTCIKVLKEGLYAVTNYDNVKERTVMGNPMEQKVSCDCRRFETHGILCSHALKVLDGMNIKLIPEHYILKRWTREARLGSNQDWKGMHVELDMKAHFMKRYSELCPPAIKLANRASESHETYTFLSKVYEESSKIVEDMLANKCVDGESSGMVQVTISLGNDKTQNNVETVVKAKGIKKLDCSRSTKKRAKSWVEKDSKKRNKYIQSQKKRKSQEKQSLAQPPNLNSISLNGTHHQASIQGTQSSQANNEILCQTAIQGTQSSEVDNGAQCQATIQGAQ